jgi:1-acyl-sn-glycerol-3-phosphate acyltransferase
MVSTNTTFFSEKLRNVLGRIWAFWGLIWFVSSLLVVIVFYLPCFVLKEPAKAK